VVAVSSINSFFILNPDNESKGYYVDTSVKIYISNIKTKYKETIDKDDTRTVYSHLGTLKYNSKNLFLSMKRIFYVKKNIELLASEQKVLIF
jgi:hypothetical protein